MVSADGVHQIDPQPFQYDVKYCSTYDTPEYRRGNALLQTLRIAFATQAHGKPINSILDFGCGNFAFLKACEGIIPDRYGYDIAEVPAPEGITLTDYSKPVDVVTFHDSLEHCLLPADVIKRLNCDTIVISCPNCDITTNGDEWFFDHYYHLKPNEHCHHWSRISLRYFMNELGWEQIRWDAHEDIVRSRSKDNILSMAFKRV